MSGDYDGSELTEGDATGRRERIELLREAAGDALACEERFGPEVVRRHVNGLSESSFERLCGSFRAVRSRRHLRDCLSHMGVYVLTTIVLVLSAPRVAAPWLHVLMVACAALMLVSVCLDVITYERVVRRNLLALHLRVDELLARGGEFAEVVRAFEGELGGSR